MQGSVSGKQLSSRARNYFVFVVENDWRADVNARDNFRWTPLHHAAHAGVKSVVEYLLMHGARLEAPAINGTTPLYRAVESNCAEIVQYLIDSGAKVRVENRCGKFRLCFWFQPRFGFFVELFTFQV